MISRVRLATESANGLNMFPRALTVLFIVFFPLWPLTAQDFDTGLEAYKKKDFDTAFQNWKPLAYEGHPEAQVRLGTLYYWGHGVPRDLERAVNWYRLAAQQQFAQGQARLGFMFDFGRGVPKNATEAVKWYRLAAEQGDAFGQMSLGKMYAKGRGVTQNDILAFMWSELAARQGSDVGAKNRDVIARRLTPNDETKSHRMVRDCIAANYKRCGR